MRTRTAPTSRATKTLRRVQRRTHADIPGRLGLLLATLDAPQPSGPVALPELVEAAVAALGDATTDVIWLALAVVSGALPDSDAVTSARRAVALDGPSEVLTAAARVITTESAGRTVRVLRDTTLVDLGDLLTSPLGTGIQRVAREVSIEWVSRYDATVLGWTDDFGALRVAGHSEVQAALDGSRSAPESSEPLTTRSTPPGDVVVPWGCTYVVPELAIQPARCAAMKALAQYSRNHSGVIGFDCVPITSSETSAQGFAGVFALNLAAVAHFDVVAAISRAAAVEYEGWRMMLEGAGLAGPSITTVGLPGHAPEPEADALREAEARLVIPGVPLVLVVGSHEPRKNHLAVLHAAEVLWRRGHRFSLTFIGGNSWGGGEFTARLMALRGAGRPVESISKFPDRLLWAAYRLARCTVFPSVNEGFGLPVAESLSAGTPAITSGFGSMREIAQAGGAVMIDPRNDDELATALEQLLTDDGLVATLSGEALSRPRTTWVQYADQLWEAFHR